MGGSSFSSSESKPSSISSTHYDRHHDYHYDNPRYGHGYNDEPKNENKSGEGTTWALVLPATLFGVFLLVVYLDRASVLKIQVGLSGEAHSLQRELTKLAGAVDTSEKEGLHFILTESAVALLRHSNFWISGYSSVERRWSLEAVEKEFKQLSAQEREKYDIESLVNVDNIKIQRSCIPNKNKLGKDYIVVTILVAIKGAPSLPVIRSTEDLRKALNYLNSISSKKNLAVEVLWSPQDTNDTLSEDELLENYPLLRPI